MESATSILLKPNSNIVIRNGKLTDLGNQEMIQAKDDQPEIINMSVLEVAALPQTNEELSGSLALMGILFISSAIAINYMRKTLFLR